MPLTAVQHTEPVVACDSGLERQPPEVLGHEGCSHEKHPSDLTQIRMLDLCHQQVHCYTIVRVLCLYAKSDLGFLGKEGDLVLYLPQQPCWVIFVP